MGHKRTETHDVRASAEGRLTAALITVSDRASMSVRPDSAGPALREVLEGEGYEVVFQRIVPDEQKRIEAAIRDAAACDVALCVSAGGTGLGPRDVTPEATAAVCERMVPGLAEAMRAASAKITPMAWLSRAVAGTLDRTLVLNVPGSPKAAVENLSCVLTPIRHGLCTLRHPSAVSGPGATQLTACRCALFDCDSTFVGVDPKKMCQLLARLVALGWRLGAVSCQPKECAEVRLDALNIHEYFEAIITSQVETSSTSALVACALKELCAPADLSVLVGEQARDVRAAADNGIACVVVRLDTKTNRTDGEIGATAVVDGVSGLAEALLGPSALAPGDCSAIGLSQRPYILFDFDGTLADTKPAIVDTARRVLSEWGMSEEEMGDLGRLVGPPFPGAFSMIYGMSEADAREITHRYRCLFATCQVPTHPLFSGMPELLRDLRAGGRRLAVCTSKMRDSCLRFLAEDGIDVLFDAVIAQVDPLRADKAHLVEDALSALGCAPDEAVMVGDRFYDVEGARACGVACIGVYYGDTASIGELEHAGAAACAPTLPELRRLLMGPLT